MNFFKINVLTFDSILNDLILGSTSLYAILNFYNTAFDLFIFLKIWHKLIFIDLKFKIILSKYSNFYNNYKLKINAIIESFIVIDYYYTNKAHAFAGDMNTGFFTNHIFWQQSKIYHKKLLFLVLCQQYTYDFFYKNFVQFLQSSKLNNNVFNIPDFFLVFSSENKMPTGAFEFLKLDLIGLGVFDMGVSAMRLHQFMYPFVCGNLSFFCFVFLLKLFFFDYVCAHFDRIKHIIHKCKNGGRLYESYDLNFNILTVTPFYKVYKLYLFKFIFEDLLLLVYLRKNINTKNMELGFEQNNIFYIYLYIFLFLKLLGRF